MPKTSKSHLASIATTNRTPTDPVNKVRSNRAARFRVARFPLFKNRAFQYGPSLAISSPGPSRTLVYYPLGSGKTLASLHAATSFLSRYPSGEILVLTTKANVETTWRAGLGKQSHTPSQFLYRV